MKDLKRDHFKKENSRSTSILFRGYFCFRRSKGLLSKKKDYEKKTQKSRDHRFFGDACYDYDYPFCYVVYFQTISISLGKDDGLSKSTSRKGPKKRTISKRNGSSCNNNFSGAK